MEILDYFDQDFKASVDTVGIAKENPCTFIVLIEDLLKLANEKLSDEINWILDCIKREKLKFNITSVSTVVEQKMTKKGYLDSGDKRALIEYILGIMGDKAYGKLLIEKAKEVL